jgi:hypothetical protein
MYPSSVICLMVTNFVNNWIYVSAHCSICTVYECWQYYCTCSKWISCVTNEKSQRMLSESMCISLIIIHCITTVMHLHSLAGQVLHFLAYFPYFGKIKGLWYHLAVCVSMSTYVNPSLQTFEYLNQSSWNLVWISWHLNQLNSIIHKSVPSVIPTLQPLKFLDVYIMPLRQSQWHTS